MSEDDQKKVNQTKFCPQCKKELPIDARFCQRCGIDITQSLDSNIKTDEWKPVTVKIQSKTNSLQKNTQINTPPNQAKIIPERECPQCHIIVKSKMLEQCPDCKAELPPLPTELKTELDMKLNPTLKKQEQKLPLEKDRWNLRESINVFINSMLISITLNFLFIMILIYSDPTIMENPETATIPINALTIIMGNLIGGSFGIYPFIYIRNKKHEFKKLGLFKQKMMKYVIIGLIFGFGLYSMDYFIGLLMDYLSSLGITIFNVPENAAEQNAVISTFNLPLIILYTISIIANLSMEEVVFRGVLQRSIIDHFKRTQKSGANWKSVIITSLIYCSYYFLFSLSYFYLIFNFIVSLIIGIIFVYCKLNLNIILLMKVIYGLIGILFLFVF